MTKDEIISIAKKFGLATWHNDMKRWTLEIGLEQFTSEIEAFATAKAHQPLTKAQVLDLWEQTYVQRGTSGLEFARAVEAAHGIGGNHG